MAKTLRVIICAILLECAALAQAPVLASQATAKLREGKTDEALQLYKAALAVAPDNIETLRDYAVALGWAEQFSQAIPVIKKLRTLQFDQPDWALREFARTYLFGDSASDALRILDELVERGDDSESTLIRRALALRWLGRTKDAESAYASALQRYPNSAAALVGVAYTQADQNRLSQALRTLDSAPALSQPKSSIVSARIRILNWMGRHYEAQRLLGTVPNDLKETRETLEDRIAAARWGGNPTGAMQELQRLATLFPGDATRKLTNELRNEYGHSISSGFRYGHDNDGLTDRTASSDLAIHLNPAHIVRAGYQYRWLEQSDVRTLVRYDLGWTGTLSRRLLLYATVSGVDFRTPGVPQKLVGDGSLSIGASDAIRVAAGGGAIVMDAYNAIANRVTAPFVFGEIVLVPNPQMRLQTRYTRYSFSNMVVRDRFDAEVTRSMLAESSARLAVGWRSNLMWHDQPTNDFYSPSQFQSHLGIVRVEGGLTSWMSYSGEIAAGWQSEPDTPILHPFQATGKLVLPATRHWRTVIEVGKSTSSLDRVGSGQRTYSRWVASAGMELRIP